MPRFQYLDSYNIGSAIFATTRHSFGRAPHSVTVNAADYTADAQGQKVFAPGHFVADVAGAARLLPRAKLTTAIPGNTTAGGAISGLFKLFKVGDVLWRLQAYGTITLALTWDTDDTVAVTIGSHAVTYTPGSADLPTAATNLANLINANVVHNKLVEAIAVGAVVYLHARNWGELLALNAVEATTGDGTATRSAANFAAPYQIGVIDAINSTNGVITLAGNAPNVVVPVGTRVGVVNANILGIYGNSIDMATAPRDIYAADTADVYTGALPYDADDDVQRQLPKCVFALKF